jgi:ubiquinone/menaquinone biosynthesis C-methylase UbiE
MEINDIKVINTYQQKYYEEYEYATIMQLISGYVDVLEKFKHRNSLKILDIGGGAGYFALSLHDYFPCENCKIYVVDTASYDTWGKNACKITFIEDSAENLSKLFEENTFDLIFANRVFHHFVKNSWRESFSGMANIMKQIAFILKKDGLFCINDYFFTGYLHHALTSRIIYTLTSITLAPIASVLKKLDAKTAGVGVCFLSKKMWLNLFSQTGFIIEILKENSNRKLKWYEKCFLLIKNNSANNVIILRKEINQ